MILKFKAKTEEDFEKIAADIDKLMKTGDERALSIMKNYEFKYAEEDKYSIGIEVDVNIDKENFDDYVYEIDVDLSKRESVILILTSILIGANIIKRLGVNIKM